MNRTIGMKESILFTYTWKSRTHVYVVLNNMFSKNKLGLNLMM